MSLCLCVYNMETKYLKWWHHAAIVPKKSFLVFCCLIEWKVMLCIHPGPNLNLNAKHLKRVFKCALKLPSIKHMLLHTLTVTGSSWLSGYVNQMFWLHPRDGENLICSQAPPLNGKYCLPDVSKKAFFTFWWLVRVRVGTSSHSVFGFPLQLDWKLFYYSNPVV